MGFVDIYFIIQYYQINFNTIQLNSIFFAMKTVNVKSLGQCPYLVSLETQDLIGQGSYAQVRIAYDKEQPSLKLAAKIFELTDATKVKSAIKQLTLVCSLPEHPHLVAYKKLKISSKHRVYIIMERCKQSLKQMIMREKAVSEEQIWNFLFQFCQGYKVLYKEGIIHRDIKPDNILIGFDNNFKIADFGLAEIFQQIPISSRTVKGSLMYLAPELLLNKQNCSPMNDVYSLGVTTYELCFKRIPYIRNLQALQSIKSFIQQVQSQKLKFPKQNPFSSSLLDLLSSMLEKQKSKRCTWQYIFHTLLQQQQKCGKVIKQKSLANSQNMYKRKFNIVEISDAMLKNLSLLDTDFYRSLSNQSLIVIDHVEADVVSKRQIVFFCDRLQYRIQIITQKHPVQCLKIFGYRLLAYTTILAQILDTEFEKYYEKVVKSEFLKIIASKKYVFLRNLVKQDFQSLRDQQFELRKKLGISQNQEYSIQKHIQTVLYSTCQQAVLALYRLGCYDQCLQVDQLEKWLQLKGKSVGLLAKLRKNENALRQYDQQTIGMTSQQLKQKISSTYLHSLSQQDNNNQNNPNINLQYLTNKQ